MYNMAPQNGPNNFHLVYQQKAQPYKSRFGPSHQYGFNEQTDLIDPKKQPESELRSISPSGYSRMPPSAMYRKTSVNSRMSSLDKRDRSRSNKPKRAAYQTVNFFNQTMT